MNVLNKFYFIFVFLFWTHSIYANVLVYGYEKKWGNNVSLSNIKEIYVPYSGYGLTVKKSSAPIFNNIDLYLNFDSNRVIDIIGNYKIKYSDFAYTKNISVNNNSAGFFKPQHYIVVNVDSNNLLANTVDIGSFSFDFYIYPILINNKTVILRKGVFFDDKFFGIKFYIYEKRLVASFYNFFYDSNGKSYTVSLKSDKSLDIKKWYHIQISFNKTTGKLALIINNIKQDIKYITVTGTPENEILIPHFSGIDGSNLELFKGFYGYADEFIFSSGSSVEYRYINYGVITSRLIDLNFYNSIVKKISFSFNEFNSGNIKIFYRKGNNKNNLTDWQTVNINRNNIIEVTDIKKLRYFQWKVEITAGDKGAPILQGVKIVYSKNKPPLPPERISAEIAGDSVVLNWAYSKSYGVKGYIIYWGTKSKNYENKLDIGNNNNYIFKNFERGKRYYFTITAYNSKEPYNESRFSKEVSVYFK